MDAIIFVFVFLGLLVNCATLLFVLRLCYLAVGWHQIFMQTKEEKPKKPDEESGLIDVP